MIGSLLSAHKEFFDEHLFISFENLISQGAFDEVKHRCLDALPLNNWQSGRNIIMPREKSKKTFTTRKLSQFFHSLLKAPPKALVFDQLLPSVDLIEGDLPPFYSEESVFLRDIFSLQGIEAALIICIQGGREDSVFYPQSEGFTTVFHGKKELPIASLHEMKETCFLLLGYGGDATCYTHQDLDPNASIMRDKGLLPGDRISLSDYPSLPRV